MIDQSYNGIAIIGMSCAFPGARDLNQYWHNLLNGVDCITRYSDEELTQAGVDPSLLQHNHYVKAKGALEGVDLFDADFFGIHPKEAELMDPQHKILLEHAWNALEHAGYNPETYPGLIGVYAGESMSSYAYLNVLPKMGGLLSVQSLQAAIGNDKDSLTTTIAYHLNLRGPAVTIQTASSTSLVAVAIACQQLLAYQCDMALAGGASAGPPLESGYLFEEGGITSSDGICRPFDEKSNGFVPGSGAGLVVLKRLEEAIRDRDTIWATIQGFALNNDGKKKVSYSAPSIDAQRDVVALAQAYAGFHPETIGYIEAHGTGTKLGDPAEVLALTEAFRMQTSKRNYCALGSVKSNIGHLDAAAGIAALIKTVLCLKYKMLVPSLHFDRPNPHLKLDSSPFFISTKTERWETVGTPLRAGVTSLGMGGTNVHLVLEEGPPPQEGSLFSEKKAHVVPLSAKTEKALVKRIAHLRAHLANSTGIVSLTDIVFSLSFGRKQMKYKCAFVVNSLEELIDALEQKEKLFFHPDVFQKEEELLEDFYESTVGRRIPLPTYPFEGKRFWIETKPVTTIGSKTQMNHSILQPRPVLKTAYEPPSSFEEVQMVQLWETALGIHAIGMNDNFFELGGASIDVTILLSSISEHFSKNINFSDFYKNPTIKAIMCFLEDKKQEIFAAILDGV